MRRLHYYPSNASLAPHILLRELGAPFELVLVDRTVGAHKSPAYMALNPNGLTPVLEDGDLVLYETVAILLHLADTHPEAGFMPAVGTPARAEAYKWAVWLTNTLQATLIPYFYPDRWVDAAAAAAAAQVRFQAQKAIGPMLGQLAALLASHGGPWLLGAAYGVADPMAFMLCRWTRGFTGDAGPPARAYPQLAAYLQRVSERPAVKAAVQAEGLDPPGY